jgi:hypothetical protein
LSKNPECRRKGYECWSLDVPVHSEDSSETTGVAPVVELSCISDSDLEVLLRMKSIQITEKESVRKGKESRKKTKKTDVKSRVNSKKVHIEFFEEPEDVSKEFTSDFGGVSAEHIRALKQQYEEKERVLEASGCAEVDTNAVEAYQKSSDEDFLKFQRRVSAFPEQCVRYHFEGVPVFLPSTSSPSLPVCLKCNKTLVFEFQVMPNAISILSEQLSLELEWSFLNMYSCASCCSFNTYNPMFIRVLNCF